MLWFLWSLDLLFTAIITSTLNRTVKGQEMLLMMMVMIKLTSCGSFRESPSVVILVTFAKFDQERLAMLRKRNEDELYSLVSSVIFIFFVFSDVPPCIDDQLFFTKRSHP